MKQRVWSLILALAMVLSLFPAPVWAEGETGTIGVSYVAPKLDGMPEQHNNQPCVLLTNSTTDWSAKWYAVQGNVTIDGTVTVTDAYTVNLILCDGAALTITGGLKLWNESQGVPQLVIYSQSGGSGRMEVTNVVGQPAIFGEGTTGVSYVRLLGGTLVAKASGDAQALDTDVQCWNEKDGTPNDRTLCTITDDGATATIAVCSKSTDYERGPNNTHRLICKECGFIPGWDGDASNGYVSCVFDEGSEPAAQENGHYSFCVCENKSSLQPHTFSSETGCCTKCGYGAAAVTTPAAKIGNVEYTSLPAALDAAGGGDTVKLLANHTTNWSNVEAGEYATLAVVKKTLTLDLNGFSVDYLTVGEVVPDEEGGILESTDGNLTVTENAQGGSCGKIKNLEFVKGSLAIQGGRIGGSLTCDGNSGTVTISGGTVCYVTVGDGATVTVTGGTGHTGTWCNDGTLNITDGTFGNVNFLNNGGTIAISGGTFGTITNINGSGSIPLMPLLADNYAFYQGDKVQDSTAKTLTNVTVRPHTHSFENGKCACGVAAIVVDNHNSCYNTLQAALAAAANDASITSVTLGQDLTEDVTFNGSAAGSLTLNMNGHKLEAEAGVPLTVTGGTLRIEGAGEVNQKPASNANAFPAISLTGGKLVIAGDLTAQGGYDSSSGRKPAIYATGGELDLQGNVSLNGGLTILGKARLTNLLTKGTFYVDASETGNAIAITDSEVPGAEVYKKALDLLAKDHAFYRADGSLADAGGFKLRTGTYTIKPHTCSYTQDEEHSMAYCNCGRRHAHRDLSDEKSTLVNGVCPICGYHCPHNTVDETTLSCSDCGAKVVAKVEVEGSEPTYAFDLASAFQNAVNGTTIKLLANGMLPDGIYASKALTLDLNGHSLSGYSLNVGGLTPTSQVRTGKLTVIDSSGGNGAVGVAVRDGGTLVFNPKNDHTTLLQLEVWGGTVELYGGKISRSGLRLNNNITLGDLLPGGAGLAYYRGGTQLTLEEAASQTCDLVVKSCSHGGKNGFDKSATACPYCSAPAVAETALSHGEGSRQQRRFADLQTALDADRDGGAELTLLADVTGDYTINGTQDTGLNLNGHSIKGTVTVKGIKGDYITTTLSNTKNTTTVSIDKVVAHKGAKLGGSGYPAVIGTLTLAEGATWKTILNDTALGYKVLNADGTHKWYARDDVKGSQLNNVIINRLPITTKNLSFKVNGTNVKGNKAERGTTVQLCAGCNTSGATVTFSILKKGETTPITLSGNDVQYTTVGTGTTKFYVAERIFNDVGSYTISFTATKDGYTVQSSEKTLTVTKPNLSNAEITFPYGNEAAFNSVSATGVPMFVVTYNGTELEENVDFVITGGGSTYDVGPCTLTIKATDNGDYTGSKSAQWTVRPLKVAASVGDIIKTYDGTTDLPANAKITFKSADTYYIGTTLRLAKDTDYEVLNAHYDSADASETEKTVSFTIKLKNAGYVFEDGTTQKDFTLNGADFDDKTFQINKATIASDTQLYQTVFNDLAKIYEIDLKQFLDTILPEGSTYGDIQYGRPGVSMYADYYPAGGANIENGKLRLSINKAASFKQGEEIGTVTVQVETTNYQPFTLTIHVSVQDKLVPVPAEGNSVSATDIIYGQTLADSKLTVNGTMQDSATGATVNGTFAWTNKDFKPDASDSYEAEWTFTPAAGYEEYATVTGTVTIKVKPAKLTVSVEASRLYYTGEEQIASIIASGESVDSTPVTFTYSDKVDGNYTSRGPTFTDAGTYTVYYKAEAANHESATGTFTVTIDPLPIRLLSVSSIYKTYDGSADVTLTADKLTFFSITAKAMNIKLPNTALTFSNAQFTKKQADGSYLPSPEVGGGKALSFTMTLTSSNYVFEGKSGGTTEVSDVFATDDVNRFTITKAAAPTLTPITRSQKYNQVTKRTITLPGLTTLGMPGDAKVPGSNAFHSGSYSPADLVTGWGVDVNTGAITYALADGVKAGDVITFTMLVRSQNYADATLTVILNVTDLDTPVVEAQDITVDYTGQPVPASEIKGAATFDGKTVKGTWSWKEGQKLTNVRDSGEKTVIFTPEDTDHYKTVETTVKLTIKRVPAVYHTLPTANTLTYTGQAQALVTPGTASGGTVKYALDGNWKWSEAIPTATEAGTYQVACGIVGDENHETTPGPSLTVIIAPAALSGVSAQQSGTLTYTGQPQSASVTTAATTVDGKPVIFTYSAKEDGDYTDVVPAFTNAGDYPVYYKASAANHAEVTGRFTVTIGRAAAIFTAPAARELTYNGQAQALVSAGSTRGGVMKYSLTQDGAYTETLPTGTGAGSYTVWYQVEGDGNHNGFGPQSVVVTIAPKTVTATVTVLGGPFTYTGSAIEPAVTVRDGETVIDSNEYTVSYDRNTHVGTAAVNVTDKAGGNYTVSGTGAFTIEKAAPAVTAPTGKTLTYDGQAQNLVNAGSTPDGTLQYSLDGTAYSTEIPAAKKAGTYTVWYQVKGDGNHTDTAPQSISVIIERRAISITGCAVADKTYTGETGGTVTAVTFRDLAQGDTLVLGSDFSASAVFASADAASDIPVTATVQLLGSDLAGNYVLTESSFQTTGSIVPAQAPAAAEGTIQIVNELVHTYTLELSKLLPTLAEPAKFGSLEYGRPDAGLGEGYGTIAIVDKDGVLSLKIAYSDSERTGEVGTITVPVTTRNYGTFDLTVRVIAQNKPIPQGEPVLSKNTLVYGEMLNTITLSGEMKVGGITVPGTFSWDEVTEPLQAGEHTLGWTFTPADGDAYRAAHGTADITVSPASLSGTAAVSTLPNGGTLADVTLTPDASWPSGDFVWVDQEGKALPGDTRVTANASYAWEFRPADSRNYLPVRGTAVLWNYTPITPVGPAKPNEPEGPAKPAFSDVDEDDFFAPAVEWAADNGITGGIGNGLFGPDRVCTRGQIVTFLWRAAGSPESSGVSGFADVAEDAYYAQAVAWAVEKGITGGIGNGLFAPDAVCTRAQIVTFLWRAAGMPAPQSGVNPFTDVPADAWYTQAVLWAVEKGITTGMGGGLFGPDVPCTRAQVVTFLYRANSAK